MKHSAPRSLSADGQTGKTTLVGNSTQVREVMREYEQQGYALIFINHEDTSRIKTAEEFMQKYFGEEGEDLSSEFIMRIDKRRKTVRIGKNEGEKSEILKLLLQNRPRKEIQEILSRMTTRKPEPESVISTNGIQGRAFPIATVADEVAKNMLRIRRVLSNPKPWKKLGKKDPK